jgi:hypothetical protein
MSTAQQSGKKSPEEEIAANNAKIAEAKKVTDKAAKEAKAVQEKKDDAVKAEADKKKEAAQVGKDKKAGFDGGFCKCTPGSPTKQEQEIIKIKREKFREEIVRIKKEVELKKTTAVEETKKLETYVRQEAAKAEEISKKAEEASVKASSEEVRAIREHEKSETTIVKNKVEQGEAAVYAAAHAWEREVAEK